MDSWPIGQERGCQKSNSLSEHHTEMRNRPKIKDEKRCIWWRCYKRRVYYGIHPRIPRPLQMKYLFLPFQFHNSDRSLARSLAISLWMAHELGILWDLKIAISLFYWSPEVGKENGSGHWELRLGTESRPIHLLLPLVPRLDLSLPFRIQPQLCKQNPVALRPRILIFLPPFPAELPLSLFARFRSATYSLSLSLSPTLSLYMYVWVCVRARAEP